MYTAIKRCIHLLEDLFQDFLHSEHCAHILDSLNIGFIAVIGYFHFFENGINLEFILQKAVFVILSIFSIVRGYHSMMMSINNRKIQEQVLKTAWDEKNIEQPMWVYYLISLLGAIIAGLLIYLFFK